MTGRCRSTTSSSWSGARRGDRGRYRLRRAVAEKRGREFLRCPSEGLRLLGIDPAAVRDVVLTHLHYDHCGNQGLFPNARFHLQAAEMAYATGPCMCHGMLRGGYDPEDIARPCASCSRAGSPITTATAAVAPGVSVHRIGGHTNGQQVVRVMTRQGWLVLASDATHFFENFERNIPFPWVYNVGATLDGFPAPARTRERRRARDPGS